MDAALVFLLAVESTEFVLLLGTLGGPLILGDSCTLDESKTSFKLAIKSCASLFD